MKIVVLEGSPNKNGSTHILADCFRQGAEEAGHTHRIAQALRALTDGDWCEIYPWQPYPMAFPELLEQVQKEIQTGCHPCLLPGAANAGEYEVIFVGSPNWCGHIAPPLASWLTKNDLSSKVILPFYSHCGGVPCDFAREIGRLCPRAEVREPLGVLEDLGVLGDDGEALWEFLREWLGRNELPVQPAAYVG